MGVSFPYPPRNPLTFPSGVQPGVDITHPASRNLRYSGIAAPGGTVINLLDGARALTQNTPTTLPTIIGPTLNALTTTGWCTGGSIVADTIAADTQGVIIIPKESTSVGRVFVRTNTNITVGIAGIVLINLVLGYITQGSVGSFGITLALDTPYFVAISVRNGNRNCIVRNLETGQIQTAETVTATAMNNSNAPYGIGGNFSGARSAGCQIAAVMFSANNYLKPQALLQWALDPWAFWYPNFPYPLVGNGASIVSATATLGMLARASATVAAMERASATIASREGTAGSGAKIMRAAAAVRTSSRLSGVAQSVERAAASIGARPGLSGAARMTRMAAGVIRSTAGLAAQQPVIATAAAGVLACLLGLVGVAAGEAPPVLRSRPRMVGKKDEASLLGQKSTPEIDVEIQE